MSVNLIWRPVVPRNKHGLSIGSGMQKILADRFGQFPIKIYSADQEFLAGLVACGHPEFKEILSALGDYDCIEVIADL